MLDIYIALIKMVYFSYYKTVSDKILPKKKLDQLIANYTVYSPRLLSGICRACLTMSCPPKTASS